MPDSDRAEIDRLRDWRHAVVTPELAALRANVRDLSRRMDKVEPKVDAMAKSDEFAALLADKLHERRGLWFTGWAKTGAFVVGLAIVATAAKAWGLG